MILKICENILNQQKWKKCYFIAISLLVNVSNKRVTDILEKIENLQYGNYMDIY